MFSWPWLTLGKEAWPEFPPRRGQSLGPPTWLWESGTRSNCGEGVNARIKGKAVPELGSFPASVAGILLGVPWEEGPNASGTGGALAGLFLSARGCLEASCNRLMFLLLSLPILCLWWGSANDPGACPCPLLPPGRGSFPESRRSCAQRLMVSIHLGKCIRENTSHAPTSCSPHSPRCRYSP